MQKVLAHKLTRWIVNCFGQLSECNGFCGMVYFHFQDYISIAIGHPSYLETT